MKQRLLSVFLILTLIASAFVGALSVSILPVSADQPSASDVLYWDDFKSDVYQKALSLSSSNANIIHNILYEVESHWSNDAWNCYINFDPDGNFSFVSYVRQNGTDFFGKGWQHSGVTDEFQISTFSGTGSTSNWKVEGYFIYYNGSFRLYGDLSQNISIPSRRSILDLSTVNNSAVLFSTPFEFNASGWKCYNLRGMSSGNTYGYSMPINIVTGSYIPPVVPFDWKKFNVGERWYVTTVDQSYMYGLFSDGDSPAHFYRILTNLRVHFLVDDSYENFELMLTPANISELPDYFVTGLTNVTNNHIYAFEITDFLLSPSAPLYSLYDSGIYYLSEDYDGDITDARKVAENTEYVVELTPDQKENSYNQALEQFHEYTENYNETHVIPETLGSTLFNAEGSKLLPCTVQLPYDLDTSNFNSDITTFAWYVGTQDHSGYNYDILDVVIVPGSAAVLSYHLRYWYDSSLNPSSVYVDLLSLENLISSFDVIIICPDSGYFGTVSYDAYTGSSGQGIQFSEDPLEWNLTQGFAILTNRAIQKQQLYNFNDGITKLYQLEVDYIDSEDAWKDSFLLWTASLYSQVDSLWGKLNQIYVLMSSWTFAEWFGDISSKLGQLVDNTSETEVQPWYLSLWNWVSQFNPSDNDFSASLEQYDNNWEDFPELPGPSNVPLLPTIGG